MTKIPRQGTYVYIIVHNTDLYFYFSIDCIYLMSRLSAPTTIMASQVSIPSTLQSISRPWTPKLVAAVNNHEVKIAMIQGAFIWHAHPNSDELFYILSGEVTLELEGAPTALLKQGDVFVVPRGVRHRPSAKSAAEILMVEMEGTINTGDVEGSGLTVVPDDIRGDGSTGKR